MTKTVLDLITRQTIIFNIFSIITIKISDFSLFGS